MEVEARGLCEPRGLRVAVDEPFVHRAGQQADVAGDGVERPDRVVAGHRHDHLAGGGDEEDVPRGGELDVEGGARIAAERAVGAADVVDGPDHVLFAGAGDRSHGLTVEVDAAQDVVDGVGDDELVAGTGGDVLGEDGDATGLAELCGGEVAVGESPFPGADAPEHGLSVRGVFDEAVVAGVGDEEVSRGQDRHLAGVEELGLRCRRGNVGAVSGMEGALRRVLLDEAFDDLPEAGAVAFPGQGRDEVALGVDDGERRPCPGRVRLPRDEVWVVEDEVFDLVALDRLVDGLDGALELELRRVDADDDEFACVLLLERPRLVEDVEAVDGKRTSRSRGGRPCRGGRRG